MLADAFERAIGNRIAYPRPHLITEIHLERKTSRERDPCILHGDAIVDARGIAYHK